MDLGLEDAPPSRSALYEAIPSRQCCRAEYDGAELSGEQLGLLEEAGRGAGVSVMVLTAREQKEQVAEYVAAGNTALFGDREWAEELKGWIRFNLRDAQRAGRAEAGANPR